jgi:hypothetical protein
MTLVFMKERVADAATMDDYRRVRRLEGLRDVEEGDQCAAAYWQSAYKMRKDTMARLWEEKEWKSMFRVTVGFDRNVA